MPVRPAAVADLFYPGDAGELASFISRALAQATAELTENSPVPKAIIVPHAGYIYSGSVAAAAYATLNKANISRVVLLGPAHRVPFYGMALPDSDAFATPLGEVQLDLESMQQALLLPAVQVNGDAHALEHSLEVQLPFLQMVLARFELVPLCIGTVETDAVARVIEALWGDERTLFVISSDLSHFHSYQEAGELDRQSIEQILNIQAGLSHQQACGATGINALLAVARKHSMQVRLLDYRNSGDTAGDKSRVVGYASLACFETEARHE